MQISEQRLQTISLLTLTVIACGMVLHLLQDVFMPFMLAVFLALDLSPVVNLQAKALRFPVSLVAGDCLSRAGLAASGLLVWSLATVLSGLAPNYGMLFLVFSAYWWS